MTVVRDVCIELVLTLLALVLVEGAVTWSTSATRINFINSDHRRAIVGGRVANPERYPYFVRLDYDGSAGCGGTLVWPDMVLTAAHCAEVDPRRIRAVVLGSNNNDAQQEERFVRWAVLHPAYDDPSNRYDAALLLLNEPVSNTPLMELSQTDHQEWLTDVNVTVIGFGSTTGTQDGPNSNVLREAVLQIVSDDNCEQGYNQGDIHGPSMLCATHHDTPQGPCFRDSGGPLIWLGQEEESDLDGTIAEYTTANNETVKRPDLQVGIVSWGGKKCADPEQPSVYVDVAHVHSWVNRAICRYSVAPPDGCEETMMEEDDDGVVYAPSWAWPKCSYLAWWLGMSLLWINLVLHA